MKFTTNLLVAVTLTGALSAAAALEAQDVPEKKRTTLGLYLDARQAHDMLNREKALFLDVRTRAEVNFLGMPQDADANVPYMVVDGMYAWDDKKEVYKLEPNSDFVSEVALRVAEKGLDKHAPVILICRSGDRSARAADLLAQAGYTRVYTVVEGFEGDMAKQGPQAGRRAVNGWKNAGLPWSYKLDKRKMYVR
ncbi:MAG: rhodanese-like domain-containing protein [Hylemonella sp.]|nr:rhodanese-like domain-containing protein [Hylemonella sp.]MDH5708586.1 rhodanese-like domain-containing protein [Hylemonella sp.]